MCAKKVVEPSSKRVGLIRAVDSPLNFFVLVVLVIEGIFGIAASFFNDQHRSWLIVAMIILIFCLIVIVALLAYYRPEALRGQRWADTHLLPNEETHSSTVTRISSVAVNSDNSTKDSSSATISRDAEIDKINVREFINNIDFSTVRKVLVLSHTGSRTFEALNEKIENLIRESNDFKGEIQVLIRTPIVESLFRNKAINYTIEKVKALKYKSVNIDVRFYEAVPSARGIVCEYHNNNRISYISSYYWHKPNVSKAANNAYIIKDTINTEDQRATIFMTWFNQYWSRDEIHTIVFDFDDTLVFSGEIQVKAWVKVIEEFIHDGIINTEHLSNRIKKYIRAGNNINIKSLSSEVMKIFTARQLAEAILEDLFVNLNQESINRINNRRFDIRESMMNQVKLFDGLENFLIKHNKIYNFAIVSSTDEQMISNYLAKHELLNYFPVILGKNDPSLKYERENIHNKAYLLIKLSEIIGIPLSRLVYIGDNISDYRATEQIGISFIEARQAAKMLGKESFVGHLNNKNQNKFFDTYEGDNLSTILNNISQKICLSK